MKKLLLDECLPQGLRKHLPGFDVYTAGFMGWNGVKNGRLLQLAVDNGFDIFLTADSNLQFQQNTIKFPIAIVAFEVVKLELENILILLPKFKQMAPILEKNKIYVIE